MAEPQGGDVQPGTQTKEKGWMSMPEILPAACPPGLGYLSLIDNVFIKQIVNMVEVVTGFETANKYEIMNQYGQRIYYAAENSGCCGRNCCTRERAFDMTIVDNTGKEVIAIDRPLKCVSCLFFCCLQTMTVMTPRGKMAGSVEQVCNPCDLPRFTILDPFGKPILRIEGPCCRSRCCDVEFFVLTLDGTMVGKISRKWSGVVREVFTDANIFGISFPVDLDVKVKATIIGACFLIDFLYFEMELGKVA